MGRSVKSASSSIGGVITQSPSMPITGVFGQGKVAFITESQAFIIPASIIRVRMWGCGGCGANAFYFGAGGGGFALKVISGLTIGASVAVMLGTVNGAATSFGSYVSATGGGPGSETVAGVGGQGIGGDINASGGKGGSGGGSWYGGGGGVGNLLGKGGDGGDTEGISSSSGGGAAGSNLSGTGGDAGGCGAAPVGSSSIDYIGCGAGKSSKVWGSTSTRPADHPNVGNGGGGHGMSAGTFPGGGGGAHSRINTRSLLIVEW